MPMAAGQQGDVGELDARFQERRKQVPVLAQRAEAEGVTAIRSYEDMVPLLFPHTTYKSYPESLVAKGRWAQMNRWLDSLSTYRVEGVDVSGVEDVDGWIARLEAAGHLASSSSGTSGKNSFLNKTARDRDVSLRNFVDCLAALGMPPERTWHVLPLGPPTGVTSHRVFRDMVVDAYHRPDGIAVAETAAPEGHHRYMARLTAMRRAMADGTARPDEVAAFEEEAARRQAEVTERLGRIADQVIAHRTERMFFTTTFPLAFRLCEALAERGLAEGDLTGANALTSGGGLKGLALPPDHRSRISRTLNVAPERLLHYYSMQELNVRMPKCPEGRYHVPPQLTLFVLDRDGESFAEASDGQAEGRAAFFDTTVDGRWGGTISGDRIRADLTGCPCGRPGPTVFDEITRYSDLPDGDKITCAGTIDAYVRGFVDA
ncbi:hypothetical protein [Actinomadura nitritigenes]|uniref:hypothetical protein n=1 Tax=Actinomadura nitritigenes TaxID=134602 RepID=UPI003D8AA14E